MEFRKFIFALRHWLLRHDIPDRDEIEVILLVPNKRCKYLVEVGLKLDFHQFELFPDPAIERINMKNMELMGTKFRIEVKEQVNDRR